MARFLNLRDEGGFALTLEHDNSCAAAWKLVRIAPAASRHVLTAPISNR